MFQVSRSWTYCFSMSKLSQPTLRREGDARLTSASSKEGKTRGVTTNVYSRKTSEKPRTGLRILRNKGSGVVYTRERY